MAAAECTLGNYTLGPLIGSGGTSEVYAGEHRFLGDQVAIKLLRSSSGNDAFLAEARRTRAIQHPNVVRVLDFGHENGKLYLVMERIAGESLATRLRRTGPLDETAVRQLGAGIADGMAAAHALGIVHRDLKPGNVMLAGDRPKVVDFGIAQHVASDPSGPRMGTPAYMAPELKAGDVIAPAADIWALGAILFEALTGRLPLDGDVPLPCSPALATLIRTCLASDPSRRPASMDAIARALRGESDERITEQLDGPVAQPPATTPAPARARRRNWIPLATGVGVAGAAAVVVAIFVWPLASPSSAASPPVAAPQPVQPRPAQPQPAQPVPEQPAPPAMSRVEIRSTPPGATIVIAGKPAGRTPATLELALPADIELRRSGYRPARARATQAGPLAVRLVRLPPAKPKAPCPMPPCEPLD